MPHTRLAALTLLCLSAIVASACRDAARQTAVAAAQTAATTRPPARQVVNANTVTRRSILLQSDAASAWQVEAIALTRRTLFVADAVRDSVLAYDLDNDGVHLDRVDRRINSLRTKRALLGAHSDSTVLLLDRDRQLLHVLHENGALLNSWRWQMKGEAAGACVANDSTVFVFLLTPTGYRTMRLTKSGSAVTESVTAEPWPGYYEQHRLTAHVLASAPVNNGACVFGHLFDRGLVLLRADAPPVSVPWIEMLKPPAAIVESTTVGQTTRRVESVQSADRGPRAIAVSGDSVLVLFEGKQKYANTQLDVYDASTRTYRHSLRFAERIESVAASSTGIALLIKNRGRISVWVLVVNAPDRAK